MTTYTTCWGRAWGLLALAGACLTLVGSGPATTLGLWIIATSLVAVCHVACANLDDAAPAVGARRTRAAVAGRSAYGGVCIVGICAWVTLAAAPALALLMIAATTSPWVLTRAHRLVHGSPDSPTGALDDPREVVVWTPPATPPARTSDVDGDTVQQLDDEELCYAWRRTYLLLSMWNDPSATLAIVRVRQVYLDEMDRRNPAGLQAWLDSGARAAGGPDRYLGSRAQKGQADAA